MKLLKEILIKIDTGISDIEIVEREDSETKEKTYYPIFHYNIDKKNLEEPIVDNIETSDFFDVTYVSPVNTYKFLLNYNQNPIL